MTAPAAFPLSLDGRPLDGGAETGPVPTVLLDLTGPEGGLFLVAAAEGRLTVRAVEDRSTPVDVHVIAGARALEAILDGRDDAQLALRTGRLEVRGDMTLALRLRTLLAPS